MTESRAWQFEPVITLEERNSYVLKCGRYVGDGWGNTVHYEYTPVEGYEVDWRDMFATLVDGERYTSSYVVSSTVDLFGAGVLREAHVETMTVTHHFEIVDDHGRTWT